MVVVWYIPISWQIIRFLVSQKNHIVAEILMKWTENPTVSWRFWKMFASKSSMNMWKTLSDLMQVCSSKRTSTRFNDFQITQWGICEVQTIYYQNGLANKVRKGSWMNLNLSREMDKLFHIYSRKGMNKMGIGEGFNWLTSALGSAVRLYSYGLKYQLWVLTSHSIYCIIP